MHELPPVEVIRTVVAVTAPFVADWPNALTQSPTARSVDDADWVALNVVELDVVIVSFSVFGVGGRFVGQGSNMQAPEADIGSFLPIVGGETVRTESVGNIDLDHNEVGLIVQSQPFNVFVNDCGLVVAIEIRGERGQP